MLKCGFCAAVSSSQTLYHIEIHSRWCGARIRKFRSLFEELGLAELLVQPTKIYVDNNVAIHWVKTGKITDGNQYLDLAYHQTREWEREGTIKVLGIHTHDNVSDLGSKPCGPEEYSRFELAQSL